MMWSPHSSSTLAVACSQLVLLVMIQFVLCSFRVFLVSDIIVSMDMAAWMFLHTMQCLVSGGTSYASVYRALRGLHMAGDLSLCICLCDHELALVMSPVIQATGRRIVHNSVWLHLMLTFAYSGLPLATHCSTKFTTVLRGSGDFRVLATWRSDSALSSESSKKMPASGISSELRAHQMALGGVVAHSSPPAGVVAQVVRSLHAAFGSWFLRLVLLARLYLVVSCIGIETRGSLDAVKEIGQVVCGTGETESSCAFPSPVLRAHLLLVGGSVLLLA